MNTVVELSNDQQVASSAILDWLYSDSPYDLSVGGLAGTGKSFLLSHLWPQLSAAGVAVATPTGKSAQVLNLKHLPATTVHRLIYKFKGLVETDEGKEEPIFADEGGWGTIDNKPPKGIAIDESSMINTEIHRDIKARRLRCLWIGDHGQLKPVGGDPGLMRNPDITLETIQRQAADNPIINMSYDIRNGAWPSKAHANGKEINVGRITKDERLVEYAIDRNIDQIIVPTNQLRHRINRLYRAKLGYPDDRTVVPNERTICLLNNYNWWVFNGSNFQS